MFLNPNISIYEITMEDPSCLMVILVLPTMDIREPIPHMQAYSLPMEDHILLTHMPPSCKVPHMCPNLINDIFSIPMLRSQQLSNVYKNKGPHLKFGKYCFDFILLDLKHGLPFFFFFFDCFVLCQFFWFVFHGIMNWLCVSFEMKPSM
jgi:hypothetical protein